MIRILTEVSTDGSYWPIRSALLFFPFTFKLADGVIALFIMVVHTDVFYHFCLPLNCR